MSKKPLIETSKNKAVNQLRGQVNAYEFILNVKNEQIVREQARLAELAVLLLEKGVLPEHVFADRDVSDHIKRCIYNHDIGSFKLYYPNGFKESNVELTGREALRSNDRLGNSEDAQ